MKILFVCTANICRSALAEVVLKKKFQQKGLTDIEVESTGVHNYEGEPRDYTMASYAQKAGYELRGAAHYVTQTMVDSADLIICMEHCHVVEIQKRLPYVRWNRIYTFNEICFGEQTGLIDPTRNTGYIYNYVLAEYLPHKLHGEYNGCMECHINGDFLLIWFDEANDIIELIRLGSHSELFG